MARMYAVSVTWRDRCRSPVVDVHPVRRRRGEFVPVDRGVGLRDDRPRVRVGGGFAGEVPGVEFREGGVDVVGVEHDARHDPLVGVDLDDVERLDVERLGAVAAEKQIRLRARRSPRVAMTVSRICWPQCRRWPACLAISASRPCRIPAFTTRRRSSTEHVVGQDLRHGVPVAGREVRQKRSYTCLPRFPAAVPAAAALRTARARRRGLPRRISRSG